MAESKPLISSLPSGPGSVSKGARVSHFYYDAITRTGELCSVLSASVRVTQAKKEKEKKIEACRTCYARSRGRIVPASPHLAIARPATVFSSFVD